MVPRYMYSQPLAAQQALVPYKEGAAIAYRFRFTSSSSKVSEVVIIREFAWNPLWVVIISVNSVDRSTLDISSTPLVI